LYRGASQQCIPALGGGTVVPGRQWWSRVWAQCWGDHPGQRVSASRRRTPFSGRPPSAGPLGAAITARKNCCASAFGCACGSPRARAVEPDFSCRVTGAGWWAISAAIGHHQRRRALPAWPPVRAEWCIGGCRRHHAQIKASSPPFRLADLGSMLGSPLFAWRLRACAVHWLALVGSLPDCPTWPSSLHRKPLTLLTAAVVRISTRQRRRLADTAPEQHVGVMWA